MIRPYKIKDFNGDTVDIVDDAHAVLEFLAGAELFVTEVVQESDHYVVNTDEPQD